MAKKRGKKRSPTRSSRPRESAKAERAAPAPKPSRAERIAAAQRHRRRRRLLTRAVVAGVLVVIAGVAAAVVINNRRASQRTINRLEAGACQFDRESDGDAGQGQNHVAGSVAYQTDPPAGGNHSASATPPGVYSNPVPPDEQVVHSMEHGDIVLWHLPEAPPDLLGELRVLADRYADDVLVVPRASLRTPVAATAWHRRLLCPTFEGTALDLFVRSFRDKGPEKVPEA